MVTSFFWIVYLDSIILETGVIAHFSDEFYSSWTAWLGSLLVASIIFIEWGAVKAVQYLQGRTSQSKVSDALCGGRRSQLSS